jgi:hypothetical protein
MNLKRINVALLIVALAAIMVVSAYPVKADDDKERGKIVGTWFCDVAVEEGQPPFRALQTFHADGTFTETSSDLAKLLEGPAHGVWSRDDGQYRLTFQLFSFDPDTHVSTGMIRVSVSLRLDGPDRLKATFGAVDFIDFDGTITELDSGPDPYTCTRVKVVPAQ